MFIQGVSIKTEPSIYKFNDLTFDVRPITPSLQTRYSVAAAANKNLFSSHLLAEFADDCLCGWSGLKDVNGVVVNYSKDLARDLITDPQNVDLAVLLFTFSQTLKLEYEREVKEAASTAGKS
jgi:hypothetical protein